MRSRVDRNSPILNAKIGQILRWLRLDCGFSLDDTARTANIPRDDLDALERGLTNIPLGRLDVLGWTLGIDPCAIVIWADIETRFTGLRDTNAPHMSRLFKRNPNPPAPAEEVRTAPVIYLVPKGGPHP